jgi:hypothetical protein
MGVVSIPPKVPALIRLLVTDQDGERMAAVAAIERTLRSAGLDFHALADQLERPAAAAPPSLAKMANAIVASDDDNDWEIGFATSIADLLRRGRRLSQKQVARLHAIYFEVV